MVDKGRPTDPNKAKNRIHSVVLIPKAEMIYRQIKNKLGTRWFHRWVSEKLIEEFEIKYEQDIELQRLLNEMRKKECIMHKAQDDFEKAKSKYLDRKSEQ